MNAKVFLFIAWDARKITRLSHKAQFPNTQY